MEDILDYLEDMIEILVLLQRDLVPFKCADCTDPEGGRCGMPYEEGIESVWFCKQTKKEYYSCPISMIPRIIYDWYDEYQLLQEFNSPMYPGNTDSLFWWFVKTYKYKSNKIDAILFEEQKNKKHKK